MNGWRIQRGFALDPSGAYERLTSVGVLGGSVAGDHLWVDSDGFELIVDAGTETPRIVHKLRSLEQNTSFGHKLTVVIGLLSTQRLPSNAIATELRTRDRQATKTIEDGKGTVLVHEGLLDVIRRRWVRVFGKIDGTIWVGGCCQDARRHTRQAEETLEQTPSLQDDEEDASEARRELGVVSIAMTYILVEDSDDTFSTYRLEKAGD